MEPTLGAALTDIFGGTAPPGTGPTSTPTPRPSTGTAKLKARLIAQANSEYAAARAALQAVNLGEFGKQLDALGKTLTKLKSLS